MKNEVFILDSNIWISYLISLCKQSRDAVLVSGDKELLKEASRYGYNVMTFKEFESINLNR